ncbi:MAG TPA: nucleotidyl transferase AbiEii/AbiGii toxin family protein [Gemmatimonadota bacterium]|nr:nucleotidyl transferase AbiEii/AbiGii toxin family protein [Gemmatimonadota bacterium]
MASRPTPDFEALIAAVARELETRDIPFMLIGGQAVLLHGEPRLTADVDVTLGVSPDELETVLDAARAAGLVILPEDPEVFVRETFVLPAAQPNTGIRVDLIFSTTLYESQAIERAVRVSVGGRDVPFASAEDLLLHKLFAGRPRDLEDAAGVVRRKHEEIDWEYIERWVEEFAAVPGRETLRDLVRHLRE